MTHMKSILVILILGFSAMINAQTREENISDLKNVLKLSLYQSEIKVDTTGLLSRADDNGFRCRYSLNDIEKVEYAFDGFHNLLIHMKEGKTVNTIIDGNESEQKMNVFSFRNQDDCEKAKRLLTEIIKPE